ncbi:hypothetical protein [Streptomyces fragilis]|nr:hypothetical protein [Streptomyces fragilis]
MCIRDSSSATHEIAHLIHPPALPDADRHLISRVFQERLALSLIHI